MPRVLIAAGPTEEPLDPVRFLSNRSTGHMGLEIVREARRRGWRVTLVLGPTHLQAPSGVRLVRVRTARQMQREVRRHVRDCRAIIMAAAVSDWRPVTEKREKIKRGKKLQTLRLVENPDILKSLPVRRKDGALFRVGFCLESGHPVREAKRKLRAKNLDLIVANRIDSGLQPFGKRPVTVWLVNRAGSQRVIRQASKRKVARVLWTTISGAMAE